MIWIILQQAWYLSLDAEAYLVNDLVAQQRPSSVPVAIAAPYVEAGDLSDAGLTDPRVQKPQLDEPAKFSTLTYRSSSHSQLIRCIPRSV